MCRNHFPSAPECRHLALSQGFVPSSHPLPQEGTAAVSVNPRSLAQLKLVHYLSYDSLILFLDSVGLL